MQSLCSELDALGAEWRYVSADISDDEGLRKVVDTAYECFERWTCSKLRGRRTAHGYTGAYAESSTT